MMTPTLRIAMLTGRSDSSSIMYNALAREFHIVGVVQESRPSRAMLLRRRARKLGYGKVLGQLMFMAYDRCLLKPNQHHSAKALLKQYGLDLAPPPADILHTVDSVNSAAAMQALGELRPDAVVVNGTRIISPQVLACVDAPFLNTHAGITPRYRGVHGGYWALACGDRPHCGVTVHLVDAGIDTGGVLYQDIIHPGQKDGFNTYPVHQIAAAIPLMKRALHDVRANTLAPRQGTGPSRLWTHPTLLEYLRSRIVRGVR